MFTLSEGPVSLESYCRIRSRRVLCNLIAEHSLAGLNTPAKASQAIEHCHRLGNTQPGKHRPIIANMFSRPLHNVLFKSAKAVNNDQSPIYFAEDMIKMTMRWNWRPAIRWRLHMTLDGRSDLGMGSSLSIRWLLKSQALIRPTFELTMWSLKLLVYPAHLRCQYHYGNIEYFSWNDPI